MDKEQSIYTTVMMKQQAEKRNKRMQLLVKPSTFDYLEQLQADGVVKSKNDLINHLLEAFISEAQLHNRKEL